jgi:hypothetical protein
MAPKQPMAALSKTHVVEATDGGWTPPRLVTPPQLGGTERGRLDAKGELKWTQLEIRLGSNTFAN